MWSSSARQINYALQPEMGMLGLRDVFVMSPASSFNQNNNISHHHQQSAALGPHSVPGSKAATVLGVGVGDGVFPLLTTTPCVAPEHMGLEDDTMNCNRSRISSGIQLWQQGQQSNYLKKPILFEDSSGRGIGSTSGMTCQDCGNQAKKDCGHRRCRTCCQSRGFDCPTHIKSTWVPAARRRERKLMDTAAAVAGSLGSISSAKKPRLITSQTTTNSHTSTSNTPPRSFDTSTSRQEASFKESLPRQVSVPAIFKCVRVTSVDDGEDEYAYQATVNIGGHVFKGFLYDQGMDTRDGFPNISELDLGGRNGASSSSPVMDPSGVYATPSRGLFGGSSYGNSIN